MFIACCIGGLFILGMFPKLDGVNVLQLASRNMDILSTGFVFADFGWIYVISIVGILLFAFLAIFVFNRKSIT